MDKIFLGTIERYLVLLLSIHIFGETLCIIVQKLFYIEGFPLELCIFSMLMFKHFHSSLAIIRIIFVTSLTQLCYEVETALNRCFQKIFEAAVGGSDDKIEKKNCTSTI